MHIKLLFLSATTDIACITNTFQLVDDVLQILRSSSM